MTEPTEGEATMTTTASTTRPEVVDADGEDITPRPPAPGSYDAMAEADAAALEVPRGAELEQYKRPPVLPTADEFAFIFQMADALARSQLVPATCRGKAADVAILLLAARDMQIPLTQALAKLHVIDGRLTLSAEVMVALALRDGHELWCEQLDGNSATACGRRKGSAFVARFTFTKDDAATADLLAKDNWVHYPKAMLWARAVSGLVRMHFPDVTAGVSYTPEEIGDDERWTAHPASALDPEVKQDFETRIAALDDDQKARLRLAWVTWGLSPLAKLTEEEAEAARDLIEKAEAIDVDEASEGAGGDGKPDGDDEPPGAPTLDTPPTGPAPAPPDVTPPEPGNVPDVDPSIARAVAAMEAELDGKPAPAADEFEVGDATSGAPIDAPDPTAISHEAPPGPTVFNGDTGHCDACGAPAWYSIAEAGEGIDGAWLHAEPGDDDRCPRGGSGGPITPAGPELDIDALYAATHPAPTAEDITAEVDGMTAFKINEAAGAAGLDRSGSPKQLKARYLAFRLAAIDRGRDGR